MKNLAQGHSQCMVEPGFKSRQLGSRADALASQFPIHQGLTETLLSAGPCVGTRGSKKNPFRALECDLGDRHTNKKD